MASRFARIALSHVAREYPNKPEHVLAGDADVLPPRDLHPVFFGSFDWHSCVHGWWTLLTLRRLFPGIAEAQEIAALADDSFTPGKVAAEVAYLDPPIRRTFERPYGWGWLLSLHLEASRHPDRGWSAALEPLARAFADRLGAFLPVLTYPIRSGAHFNTAFALVLAIDWADEFDPALGSSIRARAHSWFENDRDCPAWEPSGDDFLSPSLTEALCMARSLPAADFERWFAAFLPRLAEHEPATLFNPATVSDRTDGKIAHLDGLNLSRAWCWRSLAPRLPPDSSELARQAADEHLDSALPHVAGDYMGEHWLASFALLALLAE
ncbi:DUF2891 domain-containing protein [Sphingomonas sp.]|uniref:DUF2891 domain-containing protein n=1 Tax=Sphingomonas sp. TaxID=28214 RepID=UPI0025F241EC|nr:DUF2891 domain-containing protein [Sphingomonas sp.]